MHTLLLRLSFALTNITSLRPEDEELIDYYFTAKCEGCGEVRKDIRACVIAGNQARRNRVVHAKPECESCGRCGTVSLLPVEGDPITPQNCQDRGVMLFQYNGLVPEQYISNGGWIATTTNGDDIEVDLSNKVFHSIVDGLEVRIQLTDSKFETQP